MAHALDLHEIRSHIGLFLSHSGIIACSRVSSAWRATFLPLCWRHITLDSHRTPQPSIRILSQHASHIRSITYNGLISLKHLDFACNTRKPVGPLNSLHFFDGGKKSHDYYWNFVLTLVLMNKSTLERLHLDDIWCIPPSRFWSTISTHNHQLEDEDETQPECKEIWSQEFRGLGALRHLTLSLDIVLYSLEWCQLLSGIQNLHSLELRRLMIASSLFVELDSKYNIRNWQLRPKEPRFKFIQHLTLDRLGNLRSIVCLRAIISQCPALKSLYWRIRKGQAFPENEFCTQLIGGLWPHLEDLEVLGSMTKIRDHRIASILRNRPRFRRLCVQGSGAGPLSISELLSLAPTANHTMTIQELNFSRCENVTSSLVQNMLTSCPNLVSFYADKIDLEDAVHGEPWVCNKLKNLRLYFDLGDPLNSSSAQVAHREDDRDRACSIEDLGIIYSRLSKLTRLETLDLQRCFHPRLLIETFTRPVTRQYPTLRLRLSDGLEILSSLTRLRRIYIQDRAISISEDEFAWMKENWRELETVGIALDSGWRVVSRWAEVTPSPRDTDIIGDIRIHAELAVIALYWQTVQWSL